MGTDFANLGTNPCRLQRMPPTQSPTGPTDLLERTRTRRSHLGNIAFCEGCLEPALRRQNVRSSAAPAVDCVVGLQERRTGRNAKWSSVKSYTSELLSWCMRISSEATVFLVQQSFLLGQQQFSWCSKVFWERAVVFGLSRKPREFSELASMVFLHGSCICIVACEKCDFSVWRRSFLESKLASLL